MDAWEQLMSKYAELLIGEDDPQAIKEVQKWAIYSQIQRTMPALTSHWLSQYPEQRAVMRERFEMIKAKNEAYRAQNKKEDASESSTIPWSSIRDFCVNTFASL